MGVLLKNNNLLTVAVLAGAGFLAYNHLKKSSSTTDALNSPVGTAALGNISGVYGDAFTHKLVGTVKNSSTAGEVFGKLGYTGGLRPNQAAAAKLPAEQWREASQKYGTTNMSKSQIAAKGVQKDINAILGVRARLIRDLDKYKGSEWRSDKLRAKIAIRDARLKSLGWVGA